jgi:hypothetical protein
MASEDDGVLWLGLGGGLVLVHGMVPPAGEATGASIAQKQTTLQMLRVHWLDSRPSAGVIL